MKVAVVMNPTAGGGRMARRWPAFSAALRSRFGSVELQTTRHRGEASMLAYELAARGVDLVLAAGGDGTASETADGLLRVAAEGGPRPAFGVLPVGTGSDFAKALGLSDDPNFAADAIAKLPACRIDVGRVSYIGEDERAAARHFISVASLGLSGMVDRAVNRPSGRLDRLLPGRILFFLHALGALAAYKFPRVSISVDDTPPIEARIALVAVANNPTFGGGMRIAPGAVADDGRFEIVVARAGSRLAMMRDLPLVYSGGHRRLASCTFATGLRVTVAPLVDDPVWLDLDGESPGRLPATFEILPGALEVRGSAFRTPADAIRPAPS